jgi:LmbE family N-acetylglucosaminyl deacetylase
MFTKSKITVISAHPDDWEIGMGQFLLELLKPERSNRVQICVVTDGGAGGHTETRRSEQLAVMCYLKRRFPTSFLGLHKQSYAFADTELKASKELITYLEEVCNGSDLVFTHYAEDSHQDHRSLGVCIRPACRGIANIVYFQSYTALKFEPTLFYEFSKREMEASTGKLHLIKFHESQVRRYKGSNQDLIGDMRALGAYNGFLCKTPLRYAEGFAPWRLALRPKETKPEPRSRR